MTEAPTLAEVEALAVELARAGGAEAALALEREVVVDYKPDARGKESHDPVSEVDRTVEDLVRRRVGQRFPSHAILGVEVEEHPAAGAEWVWVIDPVDGTANFVNGFPLFAVSVGVLRDGRPVAGAVWCATTHALRPGVYHAHEGGPLRLDGVEVSSVHAGGVKRRLAAAPGGSGAGTRDWDHRVTGSMAVEGAYVAAGVFAAAPFWAPRLWDIAGVVPLVRAAGLEAWTRGRDGWTPVERFEAPDRLPRRSGEERAPSLRDWRQPVIVGTAEACAAIRRGVRRPGLLARFARRLRGRRR
jgi:myo-inositol-1(or 4)-monophosphatase